MTIAGATFESRIRDVAALALDDDRLELLAGECADDRVDRAASRELLRRELLELARWGLARPGRVVTGPVVVALPRHAVAAHVVKRALPFALSATATTIVSHPKVSDRTARITERLANELGISNLLRFEALRHKAVDSVASEPTATVVVTGRRSTVAGLRTTLQCQVIGATGHCAVVVAADDDSSRRIFRELSSHAKPGSCTNVRAAFVADDSSGHWMATCSRRRYEANEVLRRLHPSVILGFGVRAPTDSGYAFLPCDEVGRTETLQGFAADPVCGWPGDYAL